MVKKLNRRYVTTKTTKGRTYYYFRQGEKYIRLPDNPDSPEFDQEYWAIRSGKKQQQPKTTFDALIQSYYQSPIFTKKAAGTKKEYRRILELIREKNGKADFTKLRRRDVIAARDRYADTWSKANDMVALLSILAKHAIDLEWTTHNPASGVEKLTGGEYEPWPEAKLRAFERYCRDEKHEWELTAFMLGIGTGQRIGDIVCMEWSHYDGEFISVVQEKTKKRLWVACPEFLKTYLDALPRKGKFLITKSLSKGIAKKTIQERVLKIRRIIGAEKYVIHGWRYSAAVALAESGCSDSEIQAVTGHKTLDMVKKYRAQANQKRLSQSAQARRTRT
ncbi:tyrosine-type recombinase/integrase [Parasedimentitalea huanghaiensis]|uniref:Tyrosine-type recombinase/integrase n=1 Tax=Parasedimentitalea huanghaiensis TaxID=2682100 RepID=A0A6L6WAL7_9RHOB|nr:tyrosine-type recombinase/integrase [Zongyanglinia huanghaiensis]MVO14833.1 tyrosine-type recombinase/integrase [Zongyanglinia huanghaiensis]